MHSEETKRKTSEKAKLNRLNGVYKDFRGHNQPHSEETKAKIRAIVLAKVAEDPEAYSRRMAAYRKGRRMSLEAKARISSYMKTRVWTPEMREKIGSQKRGEKHPRWKGAITAINYRNRVRIMSSRPYKDWRRHVFQRDDYTCQACGQRGGKLQADHELPYSLYPELVFEVLNGRTLCEPCHRRTPTYGLNIEFSPWSDRNFPWLCKV